MRRSGVRIPLAPPQADIRFGCRFFVCLGALVRCLLLRCRWCFGRRMARPPARLGILTSFGAAPRSPPVPSGPSGALHTCGVVVIDVDRPARLLSRAAWCACARGRRPAREPSALRASLGVSSRCPARPCRRPRAPQPGYRTKRVGFVVTFRLVGGEKSVLKLVGANLKDGQNVLVL